ncbi:MAG: 16S rRNA (adenine(1518)-N(6)/adenine(1519)-N(6))-dimethyltransferase RsmA [Pseudomonadota bacterium]
MSDRAVDTLPPLRETIAAHDLRAEKRLGQNFLFDLNLTRRIAREGGAADAGAILEIGPGPGGLTRALLTEGEASVVVVEKDRRCRPILEELQAASGGRLDIVEADALTLTPDDLLQDLPRPWHIIANLPYNVGTALLVKWMSGTSRPPAIGRFTLMFQKEVAERIVAKPGTSAYGRLSILSQWRAETRLLFDVNRSAFSPPPKVTSSVVSIIPRPPKIPCDWHLLETISAMAFGQRRKMLRTSLKPLVASHPDGAERALEALCGAAGISPSDRPERVAVEAFCRLAQKAAEMGSDLRAP